MKIKDLIKATGAEIFGTNFDENQEIKISTDTRTIKKGDFYLPLKGASFDGEKFVEQAIEKGAIGTFCTETSPLTPNPSPTSGEGNEASHPNLTREGKETILLKVQNTLTAYLQLANYRRKQLNPTVIAITGSSGKTTTKELVASVVSEKFRTFKTPLNHNNEIGLCQTIFEMPDDTEVLVLEMGMRGLGEIELLSKYSEPDITIISNVGTAHIGRLGSRENIAKAKCEIVKYQRGKYFIAHDDELIRKTVNFDGEKTYYSISDVEILEKSANYSKFVYKTLSPTLPQGREISFLKNGVREGFIPCFELNVGGDYNIENALSAINAGLKLGMNIGEIQSGLKKYHPIEKRWEAVCASGFEVINDSYNANPESMRAFIDTIFEHYKNYTIVLGDMGELGENEIEYHKELGRYINSKKNLNKDAQILSVGTLSKNITDEIKHCCSKHFDSIESAVDYIRTNINNKNIIFLKASRSMKFERIIELLGSD